MTKQVFLNVSEIINKPVLSCLYVLLISYNLLKPFIPITGTFRPNESPFANDNDDRIFVNDPGPIETAINILRTGDMGSSLVLSQFTRSFSVMAASLMVDAPAKTAIDRAQKSIQTVY